MGSNRFWHIVSVVKEQLASLSSRVASNEPIKNSIPRKFVNNPFTPFFLFPQNSSAPPQLHDSQRIFLSYARNFARAAFVLPAALKKRTEVISMNTTNSRFTIALAACAL